MKTKLESGWYKFGNKVVYVKEDRILTEKDDEFGDEKETDMPITPEMGKSMIMFGWFDGLGLS
jgi:hypothetical protein